MNLCFIGGKREELATIVPGLTGGLMCVHVQVLARSSPPETPPILKIGGFFFSEAGGFCFYTFEPANVRLALMKVGRTAGSNEGGPYGRPLTRK